MKHIETKLIVEQSPYQMRDSITKFINSTLNINIISINIVNDPLKVLTNAFIIYEINI